MNCLEFRRLIDTEPDTTDEDLIRHEAQCQSCARFATRATRFSNVLNAAARIDAPENLTSRVLLRQSFSDSSVLHSRRNAMALAAGIIIVAGLAVSATYLLRPDDPLADEIFARIRQAGGTFQSTILLDNREVAEALAPVGIDVTGRLGKITYAGQSTLQGRLSGHIVLQGEWAPCTVFLIPGISVASEYTIRGDDMKGVVVPFDRGVMAIVGAPQESLAPVVERVKTAFSWRRA